ncbi:MULTISPECIES: sugar transferase [Bacillaceae]|uniref:sugar transferase n=1 Tax=Bacillaceae TaxID=186817 RepID=UPI00118942B9|nr:sugar transferase [Bacillus sp. S3]QCJ43898.1 sugar transferase [Bacillus sp. S3]
MNDRYRGSCVKLIQAVADITLVFAGFIIAYLVSYQLSIPIAGTLISSNWLILLSASSYFVFYLYDLYGDWQRKNIQHVVYSVVLSMVFFSIFISAISLLTPYLSFQQSFIFIAFLIQTILLLAARASVWYLYKKFFGKRKVIIIGEDSNAGIHLADKIINHHKGWFEISGFITAANMAIIYENIKKCDLLLLSPNLSGEDKEEILSLCMKHGKEAMVVPQQFELSVIAADIQQIDDMLVVSIKPPNISISQRFLKRGFDVLISFLLLVIASPLLLALFLFIPLTSKGPALYKQERIGQKGNPYMIYKFRSMIQDAEERTGPVLATDRDPRITAIGRFIRAVRLDELPQLLNVLKGDMSIVGPRPEREYFINQFKQKLPEYHYRLTVKPGITGLAQVLANYTTPVEDKLRFDLLYVHNYSFWLDVKILFQTIRVVLQPEQAQGLKEENNLPNQRLLKSLKKKKVMNH